MAKTVHKRKCSDPVLVSPAYTGFFCKECADAGNTGTVGLYTRENYKTNGVAVWQYKLECMTAGCSRGTAFCNSIKTAEVVFVHTCQER